eukprot:6036989-Pyramimonas_sp.AAC.1
MAPMDRTSAGASCCRDRTSEFFAVAERLRKQQGKVRPKLMQPVRLKWCGLNRVAFHNDRSLWSDRFAWEISPCGVKRELRGVSH